jgi:exodeoxyribonuclease V gamma subunit
MPLHPHFIASLDEVVAPLATLLAAPADDPFTPELIVAPSVGVQQWLAERLARSLGTGPGREDGIVANIRFDFPGALVTRALGGRVHDDPWSVERLTFTILDILTSGYSGVSRNRLERGKLPAARGIADLLDRYHYHRPLMIQSWARGEAVLTEVPGEPLAALPERERWQFDLWREAQRRIDQPSPPERVAAALASLRAGVRPAGVPSRIAIVGVTAMSPLHLSVVHALSHVIDVHLWISQPSVVRERPSLPQVDSWTRRSQAMQQLLTAAGITTTAPTPPALASVSVLARVQHAVRTDSLGATTAPAADDHSLRIHRCHGPARQAEVLREALLHTFKELPGLDPRDVLIVAPNIGAMAPHVSAVFGDARPVGDDPLHLPVVVADRSLRETSEVAELLAQLTELPLSRFGLAHFRALTALGVVQQRLAVDSDTVEQWVTWADHLHVRWGLDPRHRAHVGLEAALTEHSWLHAARRLAYGALLPDASPTRELGGVIPASGLEVGDLPAVGSLAQLLSTLSAFVDATTSGPRVVSEWCDVMQAALDALCAVARTEQPQLAAALRVLNGVGTAAAGSSSPVPFGEFRTVLAPLLSGEPGPVSLRSGRITATSLVPLRGVPYRVVCLVGLDDGALSSGDGDGDDLLRQFPLVGDPDPRAEQRQALLETLLAAQDRVIITCTGRDPRTNAEVPYITPLAELVDLVSAVTGSAEQVIVEHPRHAMDARNFDPRSPFGHVEAHAKAARLLAATVVEREVAEQPVAPERQRILTLGDLAEFINNPLDVYVRRTLEIDAFEGNAEPGAVIELGADRREISEAAAPLLARVRAAPLDDMLVDREGPAWRDAVRGTGVLPPGAYGEAMLDTGLALVEHLRVQCTGKGITFAATRSEDVVLTLANGRTIVGIVSGIVDPPEGNYTLVRVFTDQNSERRGEQQALELWLWAIHTADTSVTSFWIGMHKTNKSIHQSFARTCAVPEAATIDTLLADLTTLIELYDEAAAHPRPMFGATAENLGEPAKAQAAFSSALYNGLKPYSSEHRLYGASPSFAEVFNDPAIAAFYDRFYAWQARRVQAQTSTAKPKPRKAKS